LRPPISILNAIGVEASTIGNHEFDLGSRGLRDAFTPGSVAGYSGANFVYLSSTRFSGDADSARASPTRWATGQDADPGSKYVEGPGCSGSGDTEGGEIGLVGATTQILESISSPTGTEGRFPDRSRRQRRSQRHGAARPVA
jgi:2',3'-cyclic-nucleotide 2'-phosphodiesterase (5'-nucleotidase family)